MYSMQSQSTDLQASFIQTHKDQFMEIGYVQDPTFSNDAAAKRSYGS